MPSRRFPGPRGLARKAHQTHRALPRGQAIDIFARALAESAGPARGGGEQGRRGQQHRQRIRVRSAPDGYTLLVTGSAMTREPDAVQEGSASTPPRIWWAFGAHRQGAAIFWPTLASGITSMGQLIDQARAAPGKPFNYASAGMAARSTSRARW